MSTLHRRLAREVAATKRTQRLERIAELRHEIKAARARRQLALVAISQSCREKRSALTLACNARREAAREDARQAVQTGRSELDKLERDRRTFGKKSSPKGRLRSTAKERAAESDDEVRANLPPDLVDVFNRVRRQIKAHPRKSRTESFLEWAEENPGEVWELKAQSADRDVERLIHEYEALAGKRYREVPF